MKMLIEMENRSVVFRRKTTDEVGIVAVTTME